MAATTMTHEGRLVMQALQELLHRDYARAVSAEDLRSQSGLETGPLDEAVRDLSGGTRPYLAARYADTDAGRDLVEVRLTVDGQQFCRVRD